MKRLTPKQLWWTAGLALAIIFMLTVIPGLSYDLEGPLGTSVTKVSRSYDNTFALRSHLCTVGYSFTPQKNLKNRMGPEGFSTYDGSYYFRHGNFEFVFLKGRFGYAKMLLDS